MAEFVSRPASIVNDLWQFNAPTLIDDDVLSPSADADGTYALAGRNDDNEQQIWRMDPLPVEGTVTGFDVYLRARYLDDDEPDSEGFELQYGFDGVLNASIETFTSSLSGNGWDWFSKSYTGVWDAEVFDAFELAVKVGSISTPEDFYLASLYAVITYLDAPADSNESLTKRTSIVRTYDEEPNGELALPRRTSIMRAMPEE